MREVNKIKWFFADKEFFKTGLLEEFQNLQLLDLRSTQVSDAEAPRRVGEFERAYLSSTQVGDVKPLAGLANLRA
ncbi:MAG: hypothetical protein R2825_27445 [Saprospiraceae bacterium]